MAAKLRRALGKGKVLPVEVLQKRLAPFDRDEDGALERDELAAFFKKHRAGGPWFCEYLAGTLWKLCEVWYAQEIVWIKIEAIALLIHDTMAQAPRKAKRLRITPEGVQGYESLETLDAYEKRMEREEAEAGPSKPPRARARSGRPRGKPRSRRPGPRR
jgi:hypothetical protein